VPLKRKGLKFLYKNNHRETWWEKSFTYTSEILRDVNVNCETLYNKKYDHTKTLTK
jgi:hypothetical protein